MESLLKAMSAILKNKTMIYLTSFLSLAIRAGTISDSDYLFRIIPRSKKINI